MDSCFSLLVEFSRPTWGHLNLPCRIPRNQLPHGMALPHPKPRKGKHRNEDKPGQRGVIRNLFKRTINITDDRDAQDEMNPAANPARNDQADGVSRLL